MVPFMCKCLAVLKMKEEKSYERGQAFGGKFFFLMRLAIKSINILARTDTVSLFIYFFLVYCLFSFIY